MKIVGLTGGIGSGKSTVAALLVSLGVPVYDSDVEAKKLMKTSNKIKEKIISLLGEQSYDGDELNRKYIADKVFGQKDILKKLNKIVHPVVREHFLEWILKQDYPYVVQETALLFENGAMEFYDQIILVTAPEELRIKRVIARDKATKASVLARMENQLKDTEKMKLADHIIENIDMEKTRTKVYELNNALLEYC